MNSSEFLLGYKVLEDGRVEKWWTPHEHVKRSVACALGFNFQYDVLNNIHGDCILIYYGLDGGMRNERVELKTGRVYRGPVIILQRSPMLPKIGNFYAFVSFEDVPNLENGFNRCMSFDLTEHFENAHDYMVKHGEQSVFQVRFGNPIGGIEGAV